MKDGENRPQPEKKHPSREAEPTTFDGHEPEAYGYNPIIFRNRTLIGLDAVRKEIEIAKASHKWIADISGDEDLSQVVDYNIANVHYQIGLRDALNLIIAHLHGKRKLKELEKGESQEGGTNPKK